MAVYVWSLIVVMKSEFRSGELYLRESVNLSDLWWSSRCVIHGRRSSLLLHKNGFPLLPAPRGFGQLAVRRLLAPRRFGQLPLLPVVISCRCRADVGARAELNYSSEKMTQSAASRLAGSDAFNDTDEHRETNWLYLVLVWMEQFSGHLLVTRTGLKRFGQHCSFTHTLRQKSGIWSARRTMRMVER